MQDIFRKSLVIGIIIFFVGASVAPIISGKINIINNDEKTLNNSLSDPNKSISLLSFYTFDKTGEKQWNANLQIEIANDVYEKLEELKYMIVYKPKSDETQTLKKEFVDLLDTHGLIPTGISKNYILSLLNPPWLNNKQKTQDKKTFSPLSKSYESVLNGKILYLQQIFKNNLGKTIFKKFDKNTIISPTGKDTAEAYICSVSSGGNGATFPFYLLPRPRIITTWFAYSAQTVVAALRSTGNGTGFIAQGEQSGIMLGLIGIGITIASPGKDTVYGLVGNALYNKVSADTINFQ